MKRRIKTVSLVAFIVMFLVGFCGQVFHFRGLVFLDKKTVNGVVVKYEERNHSSIYYTYEAGPKKFEGVGFGVGYKVGDPIAISYGINDPAVSDIAENIPSPTDLLIFSFLGALFAAGAVALIVLLDAWLADKR